ncbi:flagellar type III secretion system pore protein FliP [Tropicimonas isoalkanivorans]|uniref:Flagellar biosynthetic protein FliP n=1 Tax=Tropicimonas isoalkanivorans TaxID=441112 RepID=A0A1I1L5S1_9RHOB|nr:flagellar type III secretion system pore protein FliP [Tropicimonas isoalkanivorans]SFC66348.1 flagellar biosynthetic protein FliP [Tropicimonas isoalkanivorans]
MTRSRIVWRAATILAVFAPALLAGSAQAQEVVLSLGEGNSLTATSIQLFLLVGFISFAPGLLVMATCFPLIVTVLSILRQATGLQQSPPNTLIISLALVLTYYVMDPVFTEAWTTGLRPLMQEEIDAAAAIERIVEPFSEFMLTRADPETIERMAALRQVGEVSGLDLGAPPLSVLIPSFMLSEISTAFQIGFLLFLPFLIIDLVVAAILMSMGMMMVPPALVSLPFKLAFFVVADGWALTTEALVRGYF